MVKRRISIITLSIIVYSCSYISLCFAGQKTEQQDTLQLISSLQSSLSMQAERVHLLSEQYEIAKGYFNQVLTTQTGIFSTVTVGFIALFLAASWLYYYKVSGQQIKDSVVKAELRIRDELNSEMQKRIENANKTLESQASKLERKIISLEGEVSRTMAIHAVNAKLHFLAAVWWLEAGESYIKIKVENLINISLNRALQEMEKATAEEMDSEVIQRFHDALAGIPVAIYSVQRERIEAAFKIALTRRVPAK